MKNDHRQFLYQDGVETARLFEEGEEIPEGWTDLPDSGEWDNPPVGYEKYVSNSNSYSFRELKSESTIYPAIYPENDSKSEKQDVQKKYPSQMNKDELIDLGTELGLELYGMTKKEMLEAINGKVRDSDESKD